MPQCSEPIHAKLIPNTILNVKKLKAFPQKKLKKIKSIPTTIRNEYLLSSVFFNWLTEALAREIRQNNKIKMIQIGKENSKLPLLAHDMIPYLKDSNNYTRKIYIL